MATAFPVLAGSVMHPYLRQTLSLRARRARQRRDQIAGLREPESHVTHGGMCPAIKGILMEGGRDLARIRHPYTRDLAVLVHWMRIEQYAIVAYGIAVPVAKRIGMHQVADQMDALLSDLTAARRLLQSVEAEVSRIAETCCACSGGQESQVMCSFTDAAAQKDYPRVQLAGWSPLSA